MTARQPPVADSCARHRAASRSRSSRSRSRRARRPPPDAAQPARHRDPTPAVPRTPPTQHDGGTARPPARWFLSIRMNDGHLSPEHVARVLDELAAKPTSRGEPRAPKTGADMRTTLVRVFGQAQRWGLLSRNPAALVDPPHVPETEILPLCRSTKLGPCSPPSPDTDSSRSTPWRSPTASGCRRPSAPSGPTSTSRWDPSRCGRS
jgi:hypothetical protein